MTQGTVSGLLQADFRLINVQHEVAQVADLVLHGQRHFDDVFVFSEHLALLGVRTLTRHVFQVLFIERREVDVQTRPYGVVVLAQAQHHGLLLFVDHVNRAVQPGCSQHDQTNAQQAKTSTFAAI